MEPLMVWEVFLSRQQETGTNTVSISCPRGDPGLVLVTQTAGGEAAMLNYARIREG